MLIRHDDTLDFTYRIQTAVTAEEISAELLRITRPFGLGTLIAGVIPRPGLKPPMTKGHVMFAGWPEAWMKRYVARGYVYVDPVIGTVMRRPGTAFDWSEATERYASDKRSMAMMDEAREHGLAVGFAVPFMTLEGEMATVSFGGESMELPPGAAGLIHLVGAFAMGRAFQLQGQDRRVREKLSERELEVLRWAAAGKTAWDTSVILSLAECTVKEHLASAAAKLGASNKVHTIAEAIRAGLIK